MDWQPIETAPKDGTIIEATHDRARDGSLCPPYKTFWGVGAPHRLEGYISLDGPVPPVHGYVVNEGKPWWLNEDGLKMAPTPTLWRPLTAPPTCEDGE